MRFNLKTVMIDSYPQVINSLERELARKGTDFPLLQSLVISGGSVHSDSLVSDIKELTWTLSRACPNLENLHLPISSNSVLNYISWTRILYISHLTKTLALKGEEEEAKNWMGEWGKHRLVLQGSEEATRWKISRRQAGRS